jgi:hypothetical protein
LEQPPLLLLLLLLQQLLLELRLLLLEQHLLLLLGLLLRVQGGVRHAVGCRSWRQGSRSLRLTFEYACGRRARADHCLLCLLRRCNLLRPLKLLPLLLLRHVRQAARLTARHRAAQSGQPAACQGAVALLRGRGAADAARAIQTRCSLPPIRCNRTMLRLLRLLLLRR